ncbi:MAG TPA: lantibiotic dehydratase [Mucilaginibacter sp.]|jgi:thiopeptide-type bacteriocin biosynthesis protein|nr:lantibiotic dehydratase [Mucilaginibacter sp.]
MVACKFFPLLVLRTPVYPIKNYNPAQLKAYIKDPFFQKALLLASRVLYVELKKAGFDHGKLNKKERTALLKYLNRMCFRPTPFGLFSAFSATEWSADGHLNLGSSTIHIKNSFAAQINAAQMVKSAAGPEDHCYQTNQTIYPYGDEIRYLACFPNDQQNAFEFSIRSINSHAVLKQLFTFCKKKKHFETIKNFLGSKSGITAAEAKQLLKELIDVQALTDDQAPHITGRDTVPLMNATSMGKPEDPAPGAPPEQLPVKPETIMPDADYYVNMEKAATGALDTGFQGTILKGVECLYWLNVAGLAANNPLWQFIRDFNQQFEGRLMPLLYVLDPGAGIGYKNLAGNDEKSTLLSDINWQDRHEKRTNTAGWTNTHALLLSKWKNNHPGSFTKVISLSASDIAPLKIMDSAPALPPTISVLFRVIDDQVLIESAGGATANALIGRFTPFNDCIRRLGSSIAAMETQHNPDVVFAEIAHICDFHTANINRREHLYPYEIPVMAGSLVPAARQIPLNDLWVTVINGEVILQSKRLNKRVIPRLSSAFNHTRNNLSIFRFLCDLQYQGVHAGLGLDLNAYFPNLDYYPRVECLNTVLALATWRVSRQQWQSVLDTADPGDRSGRFRAFKKSLRLPHWIALTVHDHQLVFNLSKQDHIDFFLQVIKDQEQVTIKEFLSSREKKAAVTDKLHKPFINQFVASLYHEQQVYTAKAAPFPETADELFRKVPPGTDWLYFKVYCHPSRQNELLATTISPLVKSLFKRHLISAWFFVRYADPEPHVRFRLRTGRNNAHRAFRFSCRMLNGAIKRQAVRHYSISVYERELERYGAQTIPIFEHIFFSSSKLVLSYMETPDAGDTSMTLEDFAFSDVCVILHALGFTDETAVHFLQSLSNSFMKEFEQPDLKYQLDLKYRALEKRISHVLATDRRISGSPRIRTACREFTGSLKTLFSGTGSKPPAQVAKWTADIIHMHLNRLFTEEARRQELVVYYCLFKYEKSLRMRQLKKISQGGCPA